MIAKERKKKKIEKRRKHEKRAKICPVHDPNN
jgi:hypothetical protein